MATKHERIQYTPDDTTEDAIEILIKEAYQRDKIRLTRGQALSTFVARGVADWKDEKARRNSARCSDFDAAQREAVRIIDAQEDENANNQSNATFDAADALDATMRQMFDRAKQQRK